MLLLVGPFLPLFPSLVWSFGICIALIMCRMGQSFYILIQQKKQQMLTIISVILFLQCHILLVPLLMLLKSACCTCRYELFMKAFNHISGKIDKIYKQLTKSHTHPLGGTAYLNLDNEDEPFLHGIKYTAMPPTKRFRDMEQLSGGEKTVAALALLFSIHR